MWSSLVKSVLDLVPVYQHDADVVKARTFNRKERVRMAIEALRGSGAVAGLRSWDKMKQEALEYVERREARCRFFDSLKVERGGGLGMGLQ